MLKESHSRFTVSSDGPGRPGLLSIQKPFVFSNVSYHRFIVLCMRAFLFLRKRAPKCCLVGSGPQWALEPRDYIHINIHNKTLEYAHSNNISFIVVSFTILF